MEFFVSGFVSGFCVSRFTSHLLHSYNSSSGHGSLPTNQQNTVSLQSPFSSRASYSHNSNTVIQGMQGNWKAILYYRLLLARKLTPAWNYAYQDSHSCKAIDLHRGLLQDFLLQLTHQEGFFSSSHWWSTPLSSFLQLSPCCLQVPPTSASTFPSQHWWGSWSNSHCKPPQTWLRKMVNTPALQNRQLGH